MGKDYVISTIRAEQMGLHFGVSDSTREKHTSEMLILTVMQE